MSKAQLGLGAERQTLVGAEPDGGQALDVDGGPAFFALLQVCDAWLGYFQCAVLGYYHGRMLGMLATNRIPPMIAVSIPAFNRLRAISPPAITRVIPMYIIIVFFSLKWKSYCVRTSV